MSVKTTPEQRLILILKGRGFILGAGSRRIEGNTVMMSDPTTAEEALAVRKAKIELKKQGYQYIPRKGFWFKADPVIDG